MANGGYYDSGGVERSVIGIEVIDELKGEFIVLGSRDECGLNRLREGWGYKGSTRWQENMKVFLIGVRRIAKECSLKWDDGKYYRFNGRYYSEVSLDIIGKAYDQMLEHFNILAGGVYGNKNIRKDNFIDIIRYYKPLGERVDMIGFRNGVLDVETGEFRNFSPDFPITYVHPYKYDAKASCPKWHAFLREVLPDKTSRLILQMFLGLGLVERGTVCSAEDKEKAKIELCLILLGQGSNGKSVIYQTAIGIFGKERISGVDYDELTGIGDEGMRNRSLLRGAIFNWSSDSDSRTFCRKRSGVFKRIVSGEPVTDRRIGENVSENLKIPYLIFNLNDLPMPGEQSYGLIRRLQYISFDVTIPKERQNKMLAQELVKEYPGIFNWVYRGMRELRARKYVFPEADASLRQMLLTQLQVSPTAAWINAHGMRPERQAKHELGNFIQATELYASLVKFCEDNDVEAPSAQKFGTDMRRKNFIKKRMSTGMKYLVYGCDKAELSRHIVASDFVESEIDRMRDRGRLMFVTEDD